MTKLYCILSLVVVLTLCESRYYGKIGEFLTIYVIDVGQATACLIISPSGQTMLIDAGSPGDGNRVLDVVKQAGVKQIDYMVASHYDSDHIGGIPYLAQNIRIVNYVDHGKNVEYRKSDEWWKARRTPMFHPGMGKKVDNYYDSYAKARATGRHIVLHVGDTLPIQGIEVKAVTSAGKVLSEPLRGAGHPNPACANVKLRAVEREIVSGGQFTGESFDLNDQFWGEISGDTLDEGALPDRRDVLRRSVFATH